MMSAYARTSSYKIRIMKFINSLKYTPYIEMKPMYGVYFMYTLLLSANKHLPEYQLHVQLTFD